MVSVTKSADMTLPYGMLLIQLVEHVRISHPHAFLDNLYLMDHVMIPLSERKVFRIMLSGKRPCLPTPTPSESSESISYSSHLEEENDPLVPSAVNPVPSGIKEPMLPVLQFLERVVEENGRKHKDLKLKRRNN
ncbi:hypothetical protein Tco_0816854 [Tanacetum coccineum]